MNSFCAVGTEDLNFTALIAGGYSNCSGGGTTNLTCTLGSALTVHDSNIYIGCRTLTGEENISSSSGALSIYWNRLPTIVSNFTIPTIPIYGGSFYINVILNDIDLTLDQVDNVLINLTAPNSTLLLNNFSSTCIDISGPYHRSCNSTSFLLNQNLTNSLGLWSWSWVGNINYSSNSYNSLVSGSGSFNVNETSNPDVVITAPSGTLDSASVNASFDVNEIVLGALHSCYFWVSNSTGIEIGNTTIGNCQTNTTLGFVVNNNFSLDTFQLSILAVEEKFGINYTTLATSNFSVDTIIIPPAWNERAPREFNSVQQGIFWALLIFIWLVLMLASLTFKGPNGRRMFILATMQGLMGVIIGVGFMQFNFGVGFIITLGASGIFAGLAFEGWK